MAKFILYHRGGTKITQKVHIKSADQDMLSRKDWGNFINNPENKKDLIKLICFISKQMREEIHLRFY